jgi:predicted dehydrogenase
MSNSIRPSRREFLKGSAAVAAGLAGGLSIARSAHAAGSGQRKVALIGCGGRGSGAANDHLNAAKELDDDVKIIAVADAFEDNAKRAAANITKAHPKASDITPERIFAGFDAYKQAIACGVDMVILATSPGFRPIHYKAAIEAGKHVFMEKPCCTDAPGYRMLLEANKMADEKGLKVGVGFQRRHTPGFIETIKRIHDGMIGDVLLLRGYWNGDGIWFRDRKPDQSEMDYQMRNWYHFVWLCGDNICEQHVHNIDVCNWTKNDHPVKANGMGSCIQRYKGRDPKKGMGQIFDNHFVEFTYKDGSKFYSQCRHIPKCWGGDGGEKAHGSKGTANPGGSITLNNGEKWSYQGVKGAKNVGSMVQEHMDLINAIRKDQKYNEGHHGATSSFTAVLGRMATYSGKEVQWKDAAEKGPSEMPESFAWDAKPKALPDENGNYPIAVPGVYQPY